MKEYYVYIATNNSMTLYVGVTNNLERRLFEHSSGKSGFTLKYRIDKLVYFESTNSVEDAIAREKQIKRWSRAKKIALIRSVNPEWRNLQIDFSTTLEMTNQGSDISPAENKRLYNV